MIRRIRRTFRLPSSYEDRDAGNTLTFIIMAMPVFAFVMISCIAIASSAYMKNQQNAQAQAAVETAAKIDDGTGSLGPQSVAAFIQKYDVQRLGDGTRQTRQSVNGGLVTNGPCSYRDIPGVGKVQVPYIEVTLDALRARGVSSAYKVHYTYKNGAWTNGVDAAGNPLPDSTGTIGYKAGSKGGVYNAIAVKVYDSTEVPFLFGSPCQSLTSSVSAIQFGTTGDLRKP